MPMDEVPRVDVDRCTGCEVCVVACPSGAMTGSAPIPTEVVARARGVGRFVVSCAAAGPAEAAGRTEQVMGVPCLASVHPETLMAAAGSLRGPRPTLILRHADCEGCAVGGAPVVAQSVVRRLTQSLVVTERVLVGEQIVPVADGVSPAARSEGRFSRRGLFRLRRTAPLPGVAEDATPRQLVLIAFPDLALPSIHVSDACTSCEACALACPTKALRWRSATDEDATVLLADSSRCVDCGECSRICPEGAITPVAASPLPRVRLVAHVDRKRCGRCSAILAPGEGPDCRRCTATRSFAADIWGQL